MGIGFINQGAIFDYVDGFVGDAEEEMEEVFEYAGTFFQRHARETATFQDQTKNLRNSIGYSLVKKGKPIGENFGGLGGDETWQKDTKEGLNIIAKDIKSIGLIGMAGMHYGVYVENMKGKSVISQSIPETERLLNTLFENL